MNTHIESWLVHMLNTYRSVYMDKGGVRQYTMRQILRKVSHPELVHCTITLSDTMKGVVCINAAYDLDVSAIMDISEDTDEYIEDMGVANVMFLPGKHRPPA